MITVILPCYNAADTLAACLASLAAQSYPHWEAVVVDDGSADGTADAAEACAARDARLRVLRLPHGGVSAARNAGLDAARGDLLTFLDADDALPPHALQTLAEALGDDADIACGLIARKRPGQAPQALTPLCRLDTRQRQLRALIYGDRVLNSLCNKLYRRAPLAGLRLRPGLAIGEDALFNLAAFAKARHVAMAPSVTYIYNVRGDSAMHRMAAAGHYAAHRPWLDGVADTLAALGLREAYFRPLCYSHALRLYKQGGLLCAVRGFNSLARQAALAKVDPCALPPPARPLYALVRAGLFPVVYLFICPLQRLSERCAALGRRARRLVGRL
ncbi:MAG: glycosyltransferase [Oscillospiraceae bacterium]|nr:glycosyltransferase [Oscillospiraceae bacterium]